MDVSYWAFAGTIYLIILTIQDYKNNMLVDDRHNWFMYGVTFSLIGILHAKLWYILTLLVIIYFLNKYMKKYKVLGEADINTFSWIFYGFGIISLFYFIYYSIIILFLSALFFVLKKYLFKYEKPVPFYAVILISYIVVCLMSGLYYW